MPDAFATYVRAAGDDLDPVHAGLLLAREEYPALDLALYRRRFLGLVTAARKHVGKAAPDTHSALDRLNEFFFERAGFHGNKDDYCDPRNSWLNDVMDRRTGIPITLSTLYAAIGRRLGMDVRGIGFPGRFLVRWKGRLELIVDCFEGRTIDRQGCRRILNGLYGGKVKLSEEMLAESPPRAILHRMLTNLRNIFLQRKEMLRALRFAELQVVVRPELPEVYRDRGMLRLQAEVYGAASRDLEEYLRRAPAASDAGPVREHLKLVRKLLLHSN